MLFTIFFFIINIQIILSYFWTAPLNVNLSEIVLVSNQVVSLNIHSNILCSYDSISMNWSSQHFQSDILIGIAREDMKIFALTHIHNYDFVGKYEGVIQCAINNEHCVPKVDNVIAITEKIEYPRLAIDFKEETNQPMLATTSQVIDALKFTPPLLGTAIGEWINSKRLEISVENFFIESIIKAHSKRELIEVIPKSNPKKLDSAGNIKFRLRELGKYKIFALNTSKMSLISNIEEVIIKGCEIDMVPSLTSTISLPNLEEEIRPPIDAIRIKGIIGLKGKQSGITIPSDSIAAMQKGTWSLSFWVRLLEGPTGSFRPLFYKGDISGLERTPSAWLLPNSNRMTVRASMIENKDIGRDSSIVFPTDEWVFLSFVMLNHSTSPATAPAAPALRPHADTKEPSQAPVVYSIHAYVNGVLDLSLDFLQPVTANSAPLSLFKDPSHDGFRGFVRDVCVWDGALPAATVQSLYLRGAAPSPSAFVDSVLGMMNSPHHLGNSSRAVLTEDSALHGLIWGKPMAVVDPLPEQLWREAEKAVSSCAPYAQRLDMAAEAAEAGSARGLYSWALLLLYGTDAGESTCGMANSTWTYTNDAAQFDKDRASMNRAVYALLVAAEMGHSEALVQLSILLLNGIGSSVLLDPHYIPTPLSVPLPRNRVESCDGDVCSSSDSQSSFHRTLADFLTASSCVQLPDTDSGGDKASGSTGLGDSVLCATEDPAVGATAAALGLLHLAAALAVPDAYLLLAHRYQHGIGLIQDDETAAHYALLAAAVASEGYHRLGGQPVLQSDRVDDRTERTVEKGNAGINDELIIDQRLRADNGDVGAMVATGDLYYYGARGLPRDQPRALHYYEAAAAAGSAEGRCGAAAMHLKGEGTPAGAKNVTKAEELYSAAAAQGSVKALNGLGFMYFYGQGVPKNETKAFFYFIEAATLGSSSDSLFNAAFCLEYGLGVPMDVARSVSLYRQAVQQHGHFDSAHAMGRLLLVAENSSLTRSPREALVYLSAVNKIGPWSGWIRRGLDQYLSGRYLGSLACYLYAAEMGYEVAQSNAAYVLRRKLKLYKSQSLVSSSASTDKDALQSHISTLFSRLHVRQCRLAAAQGSAESMFLLGHSYYSGQGVSRSLRSASWWYSKASVAGHSAASAYLGAMSHFGVGAEASAERAQRYYSKALDAKPSEQLPMQLQALVKGLQWSLSARRYGLLSPFATSLEYVVKVLWGNPSEW